MLKKAVQQGRSRRKHRRRSIPHPPSRAAKQLLSQVGYVEDAFEARTMPGERRVSARRGWAGEKSDFFSILLEVWFSPS
jgi:hypothetical protein